MKISNLDLISREPLNRRSRARCAFKLHIPGILFIWKGQPAIGQGCRAETAGFHASFSPG